MNLSEAMGHLDNLVGNGITHYDEALGIVMAELARADTKELETWRLVHKLVQALHDHAVYEKPQGEDDELIREACAFLGVEGYELN